MGAMPGHDLIPPPADAAPEPSHLEGHLGVGEVTDELIDPRLRQLGVAVVVDLADNLLGVPGQLDLTTRVAGSEQPDEAFTTVIGEPFSGDREEPPGPVERIRFAAAV